MATAHHACPDCGSLEIELESELLVTGLRKAKCGFCCWEGPAKDTIGLVTSETVWDIERIAMISLRVVAKHAAGPLLQLWKFTGIVPKELPITRKVTGPRRRAAEAHNAKVSEIRDEVMRAALAGVLEGAWTAAQEMRDKFPELYGSAEKEKPMPEEENDQEVDETSDTDEAPESDEDVGSEESGDEGSDDGYEGDDAPDAGDDADVADSADDDSVDDAGGDEGEPSDDSDDVGSDED